MPSNRHVTMQDVARAAGVHQTTVSLALRNDPRLPAATRERIQAHAKKLGYRPDPMLAALNFYRASRHAVKAPPTMAFLFNHADLRERSQYFPPQMFLEGARAQAATLGFHLDEFYVGHDKDAGRKMQRILKARGITGLILAAFTDLTMEFNLEWEEFSAVAIESQQLRLSLHTVSTHQQEVTREAIRQLRALGYHRIGLAVGADEEIYLKNAYTGGYFVEQSVWSELTSIPPLVFRGRTKEEIALEIGPWARRHRCEAVISNWNNIPAALELTGLHVPKDVVVASLDVLAGSGGAQAGMRQNHRIVGERAVEQLASLMRAHVRGLVAVPNTIYIEGEWVNPRGLIRKAATPAT